ncbi:MAG: dTDP-4-dehydrorhamnose 3,5-epimerase [Pseudomonadota bacterium]
MQIDVTPLADVVLITPKRFGDHRGFFSETWNRRALAEAGIDIDFVQDNHSMSALRGTLRGLHYQAPPHAQDKLVRCTAGAIWDVAVDARFGSPTYGHHFGAELTAENGTQIFVPKGFLHGFVTLSDTAEVVYKCSDYYAPESDGSVLWSSPSLGIDWPLEVGPSLSAKDGDAPDFSTWTSPFSSP